METTTANGRGVRARVLVTFTLFAAFAVLAVSGLVMYWWRALGTEEVLAMDRGKWNAVHTIVSFLVVLVAAVHVCLNWRAICHYVKCRAGETTPRLGECLIAALIVGGVIAGTLAGIPPFSSIAPKEHHGRPPAGAFPGHAPGGEQGEAHGAPEMPERPAP